MGPQLAAELTDVAGGEVALPVINQVRGLGAAHLAQFAVQVHHAGAAGALVEVVHVLGDDADLKVLFQFGQSQVAIIGGHFFELAPPLVVKIQHQCWIALPAFG